MKLKRRCIVRGCTRLTTGSRCGVHATRGPFGARPGYVYEGFPKSVKLAVLRRDGYRCRRCGSRTRLEVNHVIPSRDGGPQTEANGETLCHDCHVAETIRVMARDGGGGSRHPHIESLYSDRDPRGNSTDLGV